MSDADRPTTITSRASAAISSAKLVVDRTFPKVGDLPFATFVSFAVVLFVFTAFTDTILFIVSFRARALDQFFFPAWVEALNGIWVFAKIVLFADLAYVFFRYYCARPQDSERAKIGESEVRQPKMWVCLARCAGASMTPRGYLLLLSLLLPLNALLFYNGLGRPVYTPSRLVDYDVQKLLQPGVWPRGAGLEVDLSSWEVFRYDGGTSAPFSPALLITSRECYSANSSEYLILGRLRGGPDNASETFPKQAYCEALVGTMMAGSFGSPPALSSKSWQHEEDTWDEALEFALRLFGSLAGIVADQSEGTNTMLSMVGFSFLKDMTDVFDMYMLTFADVEQLHEGRPLLAKNSGVESYEWSYHHLVFVWVWIGMICVLLRALAIVGFTPFVYVLERAGCSCRPEQLRKPIDACCSLTFIELPYLFLRWIAWRHYGVPVSVMAVKNILGIYEDLYYLGVVRGFGDDEKRRGVRLCCRQEGSAEDDEEEKGRPPERSPDSASGAAPAPAVDGILLEEPGGDPGTGARPR